MRQDHHWTSGRDVENQMLEALSESITEALGPEAHVRDVTAQPSSSAESPVPDLVLEIHTPEKTLRVYVEFKHAVYPRDLRDAAWKLNSYMGSQGEGDNTIGMVAAASLSPGARQGLKAQGMAAFDLGGSLYLKHDGWLINIEKPAMRLKKHTQGVELFTDARESVIHALLLHGNQWFTGSELSERSQTSSYTCSKVLQELTLREWVESVGGGPSQRRRLTRPDKLLDAWAEHWQARKERQTKWYTFVENPQQVLAYLSEKLDRHQVDFPWAFTGVAAANCVAPLLTATEGAELIVPKGFTHKMADALELKSVNKGANVTITEREPASLLFRNQPAEHSTFFASLCVLYMDLLDGRGRNKELAIHIKERLESLWERT